MLQTPAETLCREVADCDLEGHAVYIVEWSEISAVLPGLHKPTAMAWTSHVLDETLEPWLTRQGRWRGPGFATIVHRDRCPTWRETLAACLHELAHWLSDNRSTNRAPANTQQRDAFMAALLRWCSAPEPTDQPPWLSHEAPFVRASAHLAHRASSVMQSIRPAHLKFSQAYYGIAEGNWMTALESELHATGSIRGILANEPPPGFKKLYDQLTSD